MAGGGLPELDSEALARAEAAVAALTADYLHWVRADMEALTAALAALHRAGPGDWAEAVERVHAIAHNIKGQGATFGYPLMTRFGQAVCAVLADSLDAGTAGLARLDALAAAMAEIVASGLSGDGGARGRDLLHSLDVERPALSPEG